MFLGVCVKLQKANITLLCLPAHPHETTLSVNPHDTTHLQMGRFS